MSDDDAKALRTIVELYPNIPYSYVVCLCAVLNTEALPAKESIAALRKAYHAAYARAGPPSRIFSDWHVICFLKTLTPKPSDVQVAGVASVLGIDLDIALKAYNE